MPKKFDEDCAFCHAIRNESGFGGVVAQLERAMLFRDEATFRVVAHSHVATTEAMHPMEAQFFDQDVAKTIHAINQLSQTPAQITPHTGDHLHVTIQLSSAAGFSTGDLREALGYSRERITDPLLKNWVDAKGRVVDWPTLKHPEAQDAIRAHLASQFETNRAYTEKEVNAVLNQWATFGDWAMLRRELFMHNFLRRYKDGSKYWAGDQEPDWR
jgi:hypothetical protein